MIKQALGHTSRNWQAKRAHQQNTLPPYMSRIILPLCDPLSIEKCPRWVLYFQSGGMTGGNMRGVLSPFFGRYPILDNLNLSKPLLCPLKIGIITILTLEGVCEG